MRNKYNQRVSVVTQDSIKGFFGEQRWLSNLFSLTAPILYISREGVSYHYFSSEAAYVAQKNDSIEYLETLENCTPDQAKRLSRTVELVEDWDNIRIYAIAMRYAVSQKFLSNADLLEKLLETGTKRLEETNDWGDTFWGVCEGIGENNLGKVLMDVRKEYARNN